MPGAPYLDVHWLFQLALHGLHRLGGHVAVELATQVGLTFAMVGLAALAAGPSRRPLVSSLGRGLLVVATSDRIMPRPEMPTFALLAAELAILERFLPGEAARSGCWSRSSSCGRTCTASSP